MSCIWRTSSQALLPFDDRDAGISGGRLRCSSWLNFRFAIICPESARHVVVSVKCLSTSSIVGLVRWKKSR